MTRFGSTYSIDTLKRMYLDEGKTEAEAAKLAIVIHKELNRLYQAERRFWKNVREHEVTFTDAFEDGVD